MTPDEQNPDASVDAAVASLFSELPRAVQEFILSPKRAQIAIDLSQKYSLHVDQAGVFERSYMLMLLGALSPEDFARELTQSGITPDVAQKLIVEVNQLVFVPIQQAERSEPKPEPAPVTPVPAPTPVSAVPPTVPAPSVPVIDAVVPAPAVAVPAYIPPAAEPQPAPAPYTAPAWPQPAQQPAWQPTATVHVYLPHQPPVTVPAVPVAASIPAQPPTPTQSPVPTVSAPPLYTPPTPPPMRASVPPPNLPGVPLTEPTHSAVPLHHTSDPYREPL